MIYWKGSCRKRSRKYYELFLGFKKDTQIFSLGSDGKIKKCIQNLDWERLEIKRDYGSILWR
jgi:hypothetical protein